MAVAAERNGGSMPAMSAKAKKRLQKMAGQYSKNDNSAEGRASRMTGVLGSMKRPLVGSGNSPEEKIKYARQNPNAERAKPSDYRSAARRRMQASTTEKAAGYRRAGVRLQEFGNGQIAAPAKRRSPNDPNNLRESITDFLGGKDARLRREQRPKNTGYSAAEMTRRENAFGKKYNLKGQALRDALARMRREADRQKIAKKVKNSPSATRN